MRGWQLAAGAILGLVIGFLVWGGRDGDPQKSEPETPEVVAPAPDPEVRRLQAQLDREQARRGEMQRELSAQPRIPAAKPRTSEPRKRKPRRERPDKVERREDWFDDKLLIGAGFDAAEVEALNERYEQIELDRLFIRDEATRQGWLGQPRYHRRMRELDERYNALRFEFGEDRYDWLLYASGNDNRVRVKRVMQGSAAADVGMEEGDILLRYDDERIFDVQILQQATGEGRVGDAVSLDVERQGEQIRLYPPRGPLGVVLVPIYVEPDPLY
ncbi:MAG: PDZ domain-containing protein [Myxococcota bacterium]